MAKTQWHKTKYPGVRYRLHPDRRHGLHPDKYFTVTYKLDGKTITEAAGWASDGVKPAEVYDDLRKIKNNRKRGGGPVTLAAMRELQKQERQVQKDKNITLDQYWPTYIESRKQDPDFKSWDKEQSHYKWWLSPVLGKKNLNTIDASSFDTLITALNGKSARSKEYISGTLRRILKHAKSRKLITDTPPSPSTIGIKGPGDSNKRIRAISGEETRDILETLKQIDIHAWRITYFAFLTGCRASEAFNLKWNKIDFTRDELTFTDTKNKDTRTLPLSEPIKKLLSDIPKGNNGDHIFLRPNRKAYIEAPRAFKNVVKALGLNDGREKNDRITFHSIRHTVATNLVDHMNLQDFMQAMGWKTIQMAMRYVKPNRDAQRSALDKLGL